MTERTAARSGLETDASGRILSVSLDNPQIVDFLGTRRDRSAVVLTLVDDWDWTDEMRHLRALQRRLLL